MTDYVARLLSPAPTPAPAVPFAQRRLADGRLVGCTRFMELRWWRGRDEPDEVEIGGTWLAADAQRTPINTEAKLLLLTHAFDVWGVVRVALATDVAQRAQPDGDRAHRRPLRGRRCATTARRSSPGEAGRPRDTALFAITDDDWPAARAALERRLRSPTVGA